MLKLFVPNPKEVLMDHDRNKTAATMRAEMDECLAKIGGMTFMVEGIIDDYPIGSKLRGKCKLGVEYKKGHGFRTVKQTTDKNGRWCKPKPCTYGPDPTSVVSYGGRLGWLAIGQSSIYVVYANRNDYDLLARANVMYPPRLKDESYSIVTHKPMTVDEVAAGKEPEVEKTEMSRLPADPPGVIECWNAWLEGRNQAINLVREKLELLRAAQSGEVA